MRDFIYITIIVVLVVLFFLLLLWRISMRRELQRLTKELIHTKEQNYNRQLTVSLFDRNLTELAVQINDNLDYQKHLKLKAEQMEVKLRQSISDIAHDLRTPLTVIRGNLQQLYRKGSLGNKSEEYLVRCLDKTQAVSHMIDEFFEMSLLESDTAKVELERIDATKLLMQFIIDHEELIREKRLVPEISLPEQSVMILADKQLLLRMLTNLLNNVIKYAKETFLVSMEQLQKEEEKYVRITFSNVLEDSNLDVEQLFERTYRGNEARHGTGTGLGLYIVKLLAIKQGALVCAEKEEGKLSIHVDFYLSS